MKYSLTKITTTEVEIDLPDACPHCGADFSEEASIREYGYIGCTWGACIVDGAFDNDGSYEDCADAVISPTSLACASCRREFATAGGDA